MAGRPHRAFTNQKTVRGKQPRRATTTTHASRAVGGWGLRAVHSGLAHLRARGLRRLTEVVRWAADDVQTRQHFAASQRTPSPVQLVPVLLRYMHTYTPCGSTDSVRGGDAEGGMDSERACGRCEGARVVWLVCEGFLGIRGHTTAPQKRACGPCLSRDVR